LAYFQKEKEMNEKNQSSSAKSEEVNLLPQIGIVSQYIKDLSFENPNAPQSVDNPNYPNVNVNVAVQANNAIDETYEVDLKITAEAKDEDKLAFILELVYGGLFRVLNIPKDQIQPVLLVECPRLIFPFARRIVADVTGDGGFPPLQLNPMDFMALYREKIAEKKK
tara:strand:- start:106996 stop:107493 length:498 start_codon:yes stop_codon:yes gene_type:complete